MSTALRAEQVGSLVRPAALQQARAEVADGRTNEAVLKPVEDRAILEALQMQREVGLDVATDGEYRRASFMDVMWRSVEGFSHHTGLGEPSGGSWRTPDGSGLLRPPTRTDRPNVVSGTLRAVSHEVAGEAEFLRQHASGPFKVTLPTATIFTPYFVPTVTDAAYPTPEALTRDAVRLLRDEVRLAIAAGCPYIQIDAPIFSAFVDAEGSQRLKQRTGQDLGRLLEMDIADSNAMVEGLRRDEVTFGLHICRGNRGASWNHQGGYDPIAEQAFSELQYDRLLLEYDTERAGGFEPLRFVPAGKVAVLGLITTKAGQLEDRQTVLARIREAAQYLPLEQLAISPQCGFASGANTNICTWDEQRRKLELVASVAREVWG